MDVETKFISNYLSKKHYNGGKFIGFTTLALCFIFSQIYWDQSLAISSMLAANAHNLFQEHQYWRLISTVLIHGDLQHFLSNSFMLYFLIYFVTAFYGSFISLALIFIGGPLVSGLCLIIYQMSYSEMTYLVGASGIVYLLWGFWLSLFLFIERRFSFIGRVIRVFGIFLILLVPTSYSPTTSYMAHYIGLILGLILGSIYYLIHKKSLHQHEKWEQIVVPDEEDDFEFE